MQKSVRPRPREVISPESPNMYVALVDTCLYSTACLLRSTLQYHPCFSSCHRVKGHTVVLSSFSARQLCAAILSPAAVQYSIVGRPVSCKVFVFSHPS